MARKKVDKKEIVSTGQKPALKKRVRRLSPEAQRKLAALKGYKAYTKVRNRYYSFLRRVVKNSKPTTDLFTALSNSRANLTGITRNETKRFDSEFIEEIEKAIPSLEEIVINPHRFIAEFSEVVQVEKARKITPRAIKHMAQNTQDISEVLGDGKVIPKRVLNVFVDDDLKIYENRFIMTLVKRLQVFIELRYKYIQDHGDTKNSDLITVGREVLIDETTFEFESKIKMTVPSDDEGQRQANQDLLDRLTQIRRRTLFLVTSPFMKEMEKATPVADPVQQTNIIRLNYAYQNAYKLWMFINRYDELGISYTTTQSKVDFNEKYLERINHLTLSAFLSIETEHGTLAPKGIKERILKPYVTAGQLDYDISDDRFLEHGLPVKVGVRSETPAQKEARLKKEEAKERAKLKREEARKKEKERAALKKAREKERAKKKKEKERLLALQRREEAKRRQAEKNIERARKRAEKQKIQAERKAFQNKLAEEARKLKEARIKVAIMAAKEKKA